jgi:hypothetical protein
MNRPLVAPLLILLGAALIIACSTGTLWFDEILSFQWAKSAKNPWQLLELYRHDNNHPLNSLWLMLLGEHRPPWAYRLLSIVSGIVSLILIHLLAIRLSPRFAWVPLLLAATSFPLVLYFSEARGYAPAIACLLGATVLILSESPRKWHIPLFWILCSLAVLSHGTSLIVLASLGSGNLLRGILEKKPPLHLLSDLLLWFGIPFVVASAHWILFLREMIVAGGPKYPVPVVLTHFFGYALGIPGAGKGHLAIAALGILALATALVLGRFPTPATRWFFAFVTVLFPTLSLLATDTTYLYFRYFLVSLPFVYLLAVPIAERISEMGRIPATAATLLLCAIVAGQFPRLWTLATQGRGDYLNALSHIASDASSSPTIVSNNDLQVGLVLGYLRSRHPELRPLRFLLNKSHSESAPDWILYATQEDPPMVPEPAIDLNGRRYAVFAKHLSAPVSGAHWTLYQIQPNTP